MADQSPCWQGRLDAVACRAALAVIHFYQRYMGWLLGGQCRFVPSCSYYGEEAFFRGPFLRALGLTVWRLMRCQPLCRAGLDPVPEDLSSPCRERRCACFTRRDLIPVSEPPMSSCNDDSPRSPS